MATDALVLKYQAIIIYSANQTSAYRTSFEWKYSLYSEQY